MKTSILLGGLLALAACHKNDDPAKATATIGGTYDFVLIKNESRPYTGTVTSSKGTLSVTQPSASSVMVVTPDFTHTATATADPAHPDLQLFNYAAPPNLSSVATFYPTGDTMHFEVYQHISASSNTTYLYRGHRRP